MMIQKGIVQVQTSQVVAKLTEFGISCDQDLCEVAIELV